MPRNFTASTIDGEFIRLSVIPSSTGLNTASVSGILIIDIFTSAGIGPQRSNFIADKLDAYLVGKSLEVRTGVITQFSLSSLDFVGIDTDNKSLFRAKYTIPFNFFGVD